MFALFATVITGSATTGHSDQFPDFPIADAVPRFLQQSQTEGRNAARRAFRAWVWEMCA